MKNLIAALEHQLKLQEELFRLLKKETGELSDVNISAMAEINTQKEDVSSRMHAHSVVLKSALHEVAVRERLAQDATLGEISAQLGQRGNREVVRLHAELNSVASQIKTMLSLNYDIAGRFVTSVGSSLDFIARIINQTSTYGASGGYQQRPAGAVLINREA